MIYHKNIEAETLENTNYRKVVYTGTKMQLVVMSLLPGEEIPEEVHDTIDQFFRVEHGKMAVIIDGKRFELSDDDVIIVPSGARHQVMKTGDEPLKLYTIYSPPEHEDGTVHKTKAEADAAEHHHE
jgi:mannose-6-phosphate isomerase-like protein (cupin superfamily)